MDKEELLSKLYKNRFSEKDILQKNKIWKVLCQSFFQRYIGRNDIVLEIGAGYGEFINNIQCREKYVIDVNDDTQCYLNPDIKFFRNRSTDLSFLKNDSIDVVFMSNFSEHLLDKEELIVTLIEIIRVLKPSGRLLILGPNIRFAYREYWDFFDHFIPLSDKALIELLEALDLKIERSIGQFLPYTTKSRIPKSAFVVWLYLQAPFMWLIIGKQMLIVAKKPGSH